MVLLSRAGTVPAPAWRVNFGPDGGWIGRHPDCLLVLPDTECHISRRHAQIGLDAQGPWLQVWGQQPVRVGENWWQRGQTARLSAHDRVQIGDFVFEFHAGLSAPESDVFAVFGLSESPPTVSPTGPPLPPKADWLALGQAFERGWGQPPLDGQNLSPEKIERLASALRALFGR